MVKCLLNQCLDKKVSPRKEKEASAEISATKYMQKEKYADNFSFRPQGSMDKGKGVTSDIPKLPTDMQLPVVEIQNSLMRELYNLSNTDTRYVEFSGVYHRINYLQDSSPKELRQWFDFGALNSIYTNPPDFAEISLLPQWINDGVKECYLHNPTIIPKDTLLLKFLSSGSDFYQEERYPAYHFIQLGKTESFAISVSQQKKDFLKFEEKDIHCRRTIGIRVVLQGLEACGKKGYRTYGGKKIYSSVMISPAKVTPPSALNYLQTKKY